MALFKFCVLCLPMIGFFSFDKGLLAGESAVGFLVLFDGWEHYFLCCFD